MIETWYADISQVKDIESFRAEVGNFLNKAFDNEPNVIHQVRFLEGVPLDLETVRNE